MDIKCFNLEDQRRFASLSGDYNPLHLDPIYSRRLLFGGPVVHGVHLVLHALEQLLAAYPSPRILKHLKAVFHNPLCLGKAFSMKILAADESGFEIQSLGSECHLSGQFQVDENAAYWSVILPDKGPSAPCRELTFQQASHAEGTAPLYLNQAELKAMFPRLAGMIPVVQVAEILAATRLTGMDCPGLHTIFHSLDLNFMKTGLPLTMSYTVNRSDKRFSIIQLDVESYGLRGRLWTFFRPSPVEQPSYEEAAAKVTPGEFQYLRALIIGGSRGLGEVSAKIIAAGGGDVCITYCRGQEDARRVEEEISKHQGKCQCIFLDVNSSTAPRWPELLQNWRPTDLFYFATPHIGPARPYEHFSSERFARYYEFYLRDFFRIIESIASWLSSDLRIFYPSTSLIETSENGWEEYIAAKARGEGLCKLIAQRWPKLKCHVPRLPLLKTDQTSGIGPRRTANPLEVLLKEIRRLEEI